MSKSSLIQHFNDGRDWFFEKRFGMFIHWGIYAVDGRHEQAWQRYCMDAGEYRKLKEGFNPGKFNPEAWLDLAEDTGMDYLVFTTKHHDGFCMWDTRQTDFNIMSTPYRKDICAMLAEACHKRDFPLEWYYSVVDWKHPSYPNIGRHHEINTDPSRHDWNSYMEFLKAQIRELCTDYGKIHGIWWDMNVPEHRDHDIHSMIRSLQPAAVINNRGFDEGDYSTPERDFDPEGANRDDLAFKRPTEACQSVGVNSWGFREDEDYYSAYYFMKSISRTLAMGGNYLLNIGPDADGNIPVQAREILGKVGSWYKRVKEAFCAPDPGFTESRELLTTRKDDNIYVHCFKGLDSSTLSLYPISGLPRRVILLNSGECVDFTAEPVIYHVGRGPHLRLRGIPVDELNDEVPVFKLEY